MSGAYEMCAKRVIERASSVAVCVHVCVRALCSVSLSLTLTVSVSAADSAKVAVGYDASLHP